MAARLLRSSKLLPPTEATSDAIERFYQMSDAAQSRTNAAFEPFAQFPKSDVRQQHVLTHSRHAEKTSSPTTEWRAQQSHLGTAGVATWPCDTHEMGCNCGRDKKLDSAISEPWLQVKVIGGDKSEEARQGRLLSRRCSSRWRQHRHCEPTSRRCGERLGHTNEGGAPEIAWKIHTKMAAEPTKVFIACDVKNGFGAARREWRRRRSQTMVVRFWDRSSPTCGRERKRYNQQPAWANTQRGSQPIPVRDGCLQGACEAPVAFALALRVASTEFDEEMRKQGGPVHGRAGILGVR